MGSFAQKLDGYKSIAGLIIVVAYYILPQYTNIHVPEFVYKLGLGIASAGLAHKVEKGTGVISKILDGLKMALDAITAKDEVKK